MRPTDPVTADNLLVLVKLAIKRLPKDLLPLVGYKVLPQRVNVTISLPSDVSEVRLEEIEVRYYLNLWQMRAEQFVIMEGEFESRWDQVVSTKPLGFMDQSVVSMDGPELSGDLHLAFYGDEASAKVILLYLPLMILALFVCGGVLRWDGRNFWRLDGSKID